MRKLKKLEPKLYKKVIRPALKKIIKQLIVEEVDQKKNMYVKWRAEGGNWDRWDRQWRGDR